jgi:hypothetical protein
MMKRAPIAASIAFQTWLEEIGAKVLAAGVAARAG